MMTKRAGFTLIELLVVIAVIAVLLAILLPALGKVREQGKRVVCSSRLREQTLAMIFYTEDNDNKVMGVGGPGNPYWFHLIAPFLGDKKYKNDPQAAYEGIMQVIICPSIRDRADGQSLQRGTAIRSWAFWWGGVGESYAEGSYTINSWLQPTGYYKPDKGSANYDNYFQKFSDARSDVPLFGDGMWVDAWPRSADPPPSNSFDGDNGSVASMHRFCIARHGRAINLSYVDGHLGTVRLENLWKQNWHRGYVPPQEDIVVPK
jgi:prepilin-type N-terminal cleavage/methylation domain-containing protein/prepilin-type processing-associated H-X9-DG protein